MHTIAVVAIILLYHIQIYDQAYIVVVDEF